jgi:FkbM family methyltransferase
MRGYNIASHGLQRFLSRLGYSLHRVETIASLRTKIDDLEKASSHDSVTIAALRTKIGELEKALQADQRDVARRLAFTEAAIRYFVNNDRSPDLSVMFEKVKPDSDPASIKDMLASKTSVEPEIAAFGRLKSRGTILDIGASWGHSAAAIWASGNNSAIISFEPNPRHHRCLEAIKEERAGLYDWCGIGLGDAPGVLTFTIPVVEGTACSGFSSVVLKDNLAWSIVVHLPEYASKYLPDVTAPRLQFAEEQWPVETLDTVVATRQFSVSTDEINAIKIDVESYEPEVLYGARETLTKHRPMLMIEGANRNPRVVSIMSALGFQFADFSANGLCFSDEPSKWVNGFYLHTSRLDEYRASGLLQ